MRQCRDTFLHFLSDNLNGTPPVHNVRLDAGKPDDSKYQMNSVNVKFLDVSPDTQIGTTVVEICIAANRELDALSWVGSVYRLLSSAYYTPKLDYTVPASPVPVGTNIMWDRNTLHFRSVYHGTGEWYFDYRCLLTLYHTVNS